MGHITKLAGSRLAGRGGNLEGMTSVTAPDSRKRGEWSELPASTVGMGQAARLATRLGRTATASPSDSSQGVELDYSSESVRHLARILEHAHKTVRKDVPEDMIFAFPGMWGDTLAKSSDANGAVRGSFLATAPLRIGFPLRSAARQFHRQCRRSGA